jgi:outer membrane protein TolC
LAYDEALVIAPTEPGLGPHEFKAEVMAMARTIAERYWRLSEQYAQLQASQGASHSAEGFLEHERQALEERRGSREDAAEASLRFEQLQLELVTKTSDVITAERQLREILGLPLADNRRLFPSTAPSVTKIEPDWDASLSVMLEKQPDVARANESMKAKPGDLYAIARGALRPVPQELLPLEQTIKRAAHAMARPFLEVDAGYLQYQNATRLRDLSKERLSSALQAYDKEGGGVMLDRLLNAVSQNAQAIAQEAALKTAYNVAIVALEEAKGTLLDKHKITLAKPPTLDAAGAGAGVEASEKDESSPAPTPAERTREHAARGKTMAFEATIRVGTIPIEIRGSVTVGPAAAVDSEGR